MSTMVTNSALATLAYQPTIGWSTDGFPDLDSDRTLVLVFGAARYLKDSTAINELRRKLPRSHFLGCSTAGEILGSELLDECLAVAVYRFEHTRVATASAPIKSRGDSFAVGEMIARKLAQPSLRGLFVLSDGLNVNGSEFARGINSVVPENVVVTGGLAGDGDRFKQTWVLNGAVPTSGIVSAVGFYGDRIHIGHGSKGGWDVFGPERVVTRSEGNVLFELDGKPALPLYKEYLGERAAGLPATALLFPLSLWDDGDDETKLVRTILAIDDGAQSMTFAGDIPQGHRAQLMRANFDRLIEGAAESAQMTRSNNHSGGACLSVAISCVGRRMVLGERTEEELEGVLDVLPAGTQQVGFYSYGEISPFVSGGRCTLHNQTMTLTTISEA